MTNGLCTIIITNQEVKLLFGMPAIRRIGDKMAKVDFIDQNTLSYTETGIAHILYAGYLNGCAANDETPVFPFNAFYSFVENAILDGQLEQVAAAVRCFEESKVVEAFSKKAAEATDTKKKTSPGMKSKVSATESLG